MRLKLEVHLHYIKTINALANWKAGMKSRTHGIESRHLETAQHEIKIAFRI